MTVLTLLAVIVFAVVHLFAGKLISLEVLPRNRWLSFAGGISVAYVFLHLLPQIAVEVEQESQSAGNSGIFFYLERRANLVALSGLVFFYVLERMARQERLECARRGDSEPPRPHVFWLHMASYGVYMALVGYLIHGERFTPVRLALFTFAIGLHFLVNDYGLRQIHKHAYRYIGRWILAAAALVGWTVGWLVEIPERIVTLLVAFLAGGIILNVLKEELPAERESRVLPFLGGVLLYTVLLLAL